MKYKISQNMIGDYFITAGGCTIFCQNKEQAEKCLQWLENPTPEVERPTVDDVFGTWDTQTACLPCPCPSKWVGQILVQTDISADGIEEAIDFFFGQVKEDEPKVEPKIINLTPHDVVVHLEGEKKIYPKSGEVARVTTKSVQVGEVDGVPVFEQTYGEIEGLPDPQDGVYYIVSLVVRQAAQAQGRTDVISPDTSPSGAVRNEAGQIIGTKGFVR